MRKNYWIWIYILMIGLCNVVLIGYGSKVDDYFNLLFLNTKRFIDYQLPIFSLLHVVSFCLLYNLIMYRVLPNISESIGFLSMMIYRVGIISVFRKLNREQIKNSILLVFSIFLTICLSFFFHNLSHIPKIEIISFASGFLYLIKYFLFVNIGIVLFNFFSILSRSNQGIILIHSSFFFLWLVDSFFPIHTITYSAHLYEEFIGCIVMFIMLTILYFICEKKLRKKGDIL